MAPPKHWAALDQKRCHPTSRPTLTQQSTKPTQTTQLGLYRTQSCQATPQTLILSRYSLKIHLQHTSYLQILSRPVRTLKLDCVTVLKAMIPGGPARLVIIILILSQSFQLYTSRTRSMITMCKNSQAMQVIDYF